MARDDQFRDYVYVSARKVHRMSETLRRHTGLRRLRQVNLNVGLIGAGAGFEPGDDRAPNVIAAVPAVERALRRRYGIASVAQSDLKVGQWALVEAWEMAYGALSYMSAIDGDRVVWPQGDAVLFVARQGSLGIILGGSTDHLLDRRVAADARQLHGSLLGGLDDLLRLAAREAFDTDTTTDPWFKYPEVVFTAILGNLGFGGLQPMTALARISRIDDDPSGFRLILGSPLWVTFAVPAKVGDGRF